MDKDLFKESNIIVIILLLIDEQLLNFFVVLLFDNVVQLHSYLKLFVTYRLQLEIFFI